jgi:hypothetical protein
LINTTNATLEISYGKIISFLLDKDGEMIYDDDYKYYFVNPDSEQGKGYMQSGRIKSGDVFIIRTGFRCVGGECVNVTAGLYHGKYE